ncbi:uncharacterized protein LOC117817275 isoform X2 [Notolabrus celidotus]|nr:uncharacterized protein LOC117817275 isoform X2 [Notolabrus celidotus]XP_034545775.1 uncharacterized protein LOC117817275 isoform X2 [Notolabrus celidotus]
MSFLEGSRGIYRPIMVLFNTPIYNRALQLCWHERSYKSQIALVVGLLKLQQKNQIPSQVTAEDMTSLIFEKSTGNLRERFWEFELEGLDEDEAKPLMKLVWSVNVNNKMRDVENEAKVLLNSQEALPPYFKHPKLLSVVKDYAEILSHRQKEAPSARLLRPQEVVLEVVPKVLQGFWVLPLQPLLNMPSRQLSIMSVGVTKAVMDGVSSTLTTLRHQAIFSRSIRDEMIQSILAKIRVACPYDILVDRIEAFSPVLLNDIVEVAVGQICEMFQSQSCEEPVHLTSTVDPPASTPVQDQFNWALTEEGTSSDEDSAAVSPPPPLPYPAEPPSISVTQKSFANDMTEIEQQTLSQEESYSTVSSPPAPLPPTEPQSKLQAQKDMYEKTVVEKLQALQALNINAHINRVFAAMRDGVFKTNSAETEQRTFSSEADCPGYPYSSVLKNREGKNESQKLTADQIQLHFLLLNLR